MNVSLLPALPNQLLLMKKITTLALCVLSLLGMYACDNSLDKVFDNQTLVEFDDAITRANAVGRNFSITPVTNTTATTTVIARLNLVGAQRSAPLTVRVTPDPAFTTAAATSYSLANGGNVVIPANDSFGSLTMVVSRATTTTATAANVVLVIDSTSTDYKASQNYKRLGYSFRQ